MDFTTYETFLENLSSIMSGINRLIQKVDDRHGKRFAWSPVAPDVIEEETLSYIGWGASYTNTESIPQAILEHLDCNIYVVELVCMNYCSENCYLLSIGY